MSQAKGNNKNIANENIANIESNHQKLLLNAVITQKKCASESKDIAEKVPKADENNCIEQIGQVEQMLHLGFMRLNKKAFFKFSNYFTAIFYVAPSFGILPILFSPEDVDFSYGTIKGTILKNGKPETFKTKIPPIVDNSILDSSYDHFMSRMDSQAYMIRHGLKTTKLKTYNMLINDGKFSDILIPTIPVKSISDITSILDSKGVILKHASGSGGKSIIKISTSGSGSYLVTKGNEKFTFSYNELCSFYDSNIKNRAYLSQPFINSTTKNGEPFDIRIHARRGANGKFVVTPYPRIGNPKGVISNIASGGYTMPIDIFLQSNYGDKNKSIWSKIKQIGDAFPEYYASFFEAEIFDIGLDIGIDKKGDDFELYLFEVNTYIGGYKFELEDAVTHCHYYRYLADKLKI